MSQIKNSFDRVTLGKIFRGGLYATLGFAGAALPILAYSLPQETWWGAGFAWLFPVVRTVIAEYMKGKDKPLTLIAEDNPYENLDVR
jgi:hypothetical protein